MTTTQLMVEGEPAALIIEALLEVFSEGHGVDGMFQIDSRIGGDSGAALIHALGRIEAELKADDMRSFLPGGTRRSRTDEQRRADALGVLVERIAEVVPS